MPGGWPAAALAGAKRVVIALARVGAEHAETYPRWVFSFIGVAPAFIRADGISAGQREAALSGALKSAAELKAA